MADQTSGVAYGKLKADANYIKNIPENTRERWLAIEGLDKPAETVEDSNGSAERLYLFEVSLGDNPQEETGDVRTLQYFFLRTDRVLSAKRESGEQAVFVLLIKVRSKEAERRVSSFLFLQAQLCRENFRIYTRRGENSYCYPLRPPEDLGRLPPLIRVTEWSGESGIPYVQLAEYSPPLDQEEAPLDPEKASLSQEQIHACSEEAKQLIYTKSFKNSDRKQPNEEEKRALARKPLTLFGAEASLAPFQGLCANYLIKALTGLRGKAGGGIKVEAKCALIDKLCQYVCDRLRNTTPLGMYIWLLYLYFLARTHELVKEEATGSYALWEDRLEKTFTDATAYADGLLQLLENSCMHTQAKAGYLNVRVHYVDRDAPDSELEDVASRRNRLTQRYFRAAEGAPCALFPQKLKLGAGIPYYFEIKVCDDATRTEFKSDGKRSTLPCGIPMMYKKNRGLPEEEVPDLFDIFDERSENKTPSDIAFHYGLPLLKKIVLRNNGFFSVSTPSIASGWEEIYSAFVERGLTDVERELTGRVVKLDENLQEVTDPEDAHFMIRRDLGQQQAKRRESAPRTTEYRIILPMSYNWQETAEVQTRSIQPTRFPLDLSALRERRFYSVKPQLCLRSGCEDVFQQIRNVPETAPSDQERESLQGKKKKLVNQILEYLRDSLRGIDWYNDHRICVLDFSGLKGVDVELSAKALSLYISEQPNKPGAVRQKEMLFAVYLENSLHIQEFIRYFSVIYDNWGRNRYMDGVQIAVCSRNVELKIPEVNFLLAGPSLSSARDTAEIFAYYNSESTLGLLPQIRYLSEGTRMDVSGPSSESVEPFPFDLYLCEDPVSTDDSSESGGVAAAPASNCWFLQRMARLVGKELREKGLGCKINNVHVRLGSKMHIEDFYEAELLFQNISVVSRFAYLLVRAILSKGSVVNGPLLLVGYEDYSTILLEYVVQFLRECSFYDTMYGLYGFDAEGRGRFFPSAALNASGVKENSQIVTVYPIGTTLSTLYQMADGVREYARKNGSAVWGDAPCANFCLLIVADTDSPMPLSQYYWTCPEEQPNSILNPSAEERSILTMENDRKSRPTFKVQYFLMAQTVWHDARQCIKEPPRRESVLTYVDATSTVPSMIFPLTGRRNDGAVGLLSANAEKDNVVRLSLLKGYISYGHITAGNNHFLYDIDLPGYFERARQDVESWLRGLYRKVDAQAFNIIVSPLDKGNTAFLKAVVDHVFAHSIRILRIPFLEARKEDIRAKFSFIAEEYRKIKQQNPTAKVNIYYAANSIVAGETFNRARKLIQMLLEDSGLYTGSPHLFRGVFLLINRNSRSTAQTMVEDVDTQFHAYLHLAVPHYNTYKGDCPACARLRRDQMIIRHCATNVCRQVFRHMADKRQPRAREAHRDWQREELWQSPKSFRELCQWLYKHRANVSALSPQVQGIADRLYTWCLEKVKRKPLQELGCLEAHRAELRKEGLEKPLETLWLDSVLQDKAYMRLSSTHWAYCFLECDEIRNSASEEQEALARKKILELFKKEQSLPPTEHIEWIISYIKVISREYLSRHYYIRQAIFRILADLLSLMLGDPVKDQGQQALGDVISVCAKAHPLQQYQLLMTLLWQLSSMQANIFIRRETLLGLNSKLKVLSSQYDQAVVKDPALALCPLPTEAQMELDYMRCVKWGSLSGDEENKCFLLQREQSVWKGGAS